MITLTAGKLQISIDFEAGRIAALSLNGTARLGGSAPLFRLGLRSTDGELEVLSAYDAHAFEPLPGSEGGVYRGFEKYPELTVTASVRIAAASGEL